ncbi:hypothetical protein WA158_007895 [Blastocystis sp. Blastoise]
MANNQDRSISDKNNQSENGNQVKLEAKQTKRQRDLAKMSQTEKDQRTVFASNIPEGLTEKHLLAAFSTIGRVLSVTMIQDSEGKLTECKVIFDTLSSTAKCLNNIDGVRIREHILSVYQPKTKDNTTLLLPGTYVNPALKRQQCTIYVGSINYSIPAASIQMIFSPFGTILNCRMIEDAATGMHKGYGFIEFDNPESAKKAIEAMNGVTIEGRPMKVRYASTCIPGLGVNSNLINTF